MTSTQQTEEKKDVKSVPNPPSTNEHGGLQVSKAHTIICTQIISTNMAIIEHSRKKLNIMESMKQEFEKCPDAATVSTVIQGLSQELILCRGIQCACLQIMLEVLKYKPADMTEERKEFWSQVQSSCEKIIDTALVVFSKGASYIGFLIRISDSCQYFVSTQSMENPCPLSQSFTFLNKDLSEFQQFCTEFVKILSRLNQVLIEALKQMMKNNIGQNIAITLDNLPKRQKALVNAFSECNRIENEWAKKEYDLKVQIAKMQGEIAEAEIEVQFAGSRIEDKKRAMERYEEEEKKLREAAEKATDFKEEIVTHAWKETISTPRYKNKTIYKKTPVISASSSFFSSSYSETYKTTTTTVEQFSHFDYSTIEHGAVTKRVETGDQTRLYKNANNAKTLKDEETKEKEKEEKNKEHWIKKLAVSNNERDALEGKLKSLLLEKENALKLANTNREKYENELKEAQNEIDTCIKTTGVAEENLVTFLSLTDTLMKVTLNTTINVEEFQTTIGEFNVLLERRCINSMPLETYFTEINSFGGKNNNKILDVLKNEDVTNLNDLSCDSQEDFDEIFLPLLKMAITGDPEGKIKGPQQLKVQKLKKVAVNEESIKKMQQDYVQVNKILLMKQFPVFVVIFNRTYNVLKDGCAQLKIDIAK